MRKLVIYLAAILLLFGNSAASQSLDEILKEHFSAMGQENILKSSSQKISGKMVQQGIEIPFIQMAKRPDKVRVEGTFQALTFITNYNGKEGWNLNPFTGVTDPQPMSEDELKSMRYQADMDGMLWKWKDKGYTVSYEGKEDMEGTSCFKIKLITKEGDTFTYYIDSDSYIMLRSNSKLTVMGNESESDQYYSNYMMVEGMAVPGKIDTKMNGQLMGSLIIDKVELNVELMDSLFEKPAN